MKAQMNRQCKKNIPSSLISSTLVIFLGVVSLASITIFSTPALAESLAGSATKNESVKEKVMETKESLEQDLKGGIDSVQLQIKELKSKTQKASGQLKRDLDKKIEELNRQEEDLKSKMKSLKNSSGLAWDDLKKGAKGALDNIKKSVQDAKERFK